MQVTGLTRMTIHRLQRAGDLLSHDRRGAAIACGCHNGLRLSVDLGFEAIAKA
jgi:hypothetical protein